MKRDEVLALLRGYRAELEEYGVKSLAIFGSVARNEETDQSDVDILVHEYFGVILSILWHTIQQNLPPFIEKLDKNLASENE